LLISVFPFAGLFRKVISVLYFYYIEVVTHHNDFLETFALLLLLLLLLVVVVVFSPWASLGRNQSPIRRPVWLWYAASWASS